MPKYPRQRIQTWLNLSGNDNHIYPRQMSIEGCLWKCPHIFILINRNMMYKILRQSASCSIYLKIMRILVTAYTTMRGEHNTRKSTTHYIQK